MTRDPARSQSDVIVIYGRNIRFTDEPSFDFALMARTHVSARAARCWSERTRRELDSELQLLRGIRRSVERALRERAMGKREPFDSLVHSVAELPADEHGWCDILVSMNSGEWVASGLADLALVRFGDYVTGRESVLSGLRCHAAVTGQPGPDDPRPAQDGSDAEDPLARTADSLSAGDTSHEFLHSPPSRSNPVDRAEEPPPQAPWNPRTSGAGSGSGQDGAGPASHAEDVLSNWTDPGGFGGLGARHREGQGDFSPASPRRLAPGEREAIQLPPGFALVLDCAGLRFALLPEGSAAATGFPTYALKAGTNVVGRDPACDIVLQGRGNRISRMHVVVVSEGNGCFTLTDLSRNGTWFCGVPATR